MKKGRLIVISGPSGVGKGTVVKGLIARDPNVRLSISATTREIRPSETHGVQYSFITKEEFEQKIDEGAFLEYAVYANNYYGTPEAPVNRMLEEGLDVILEIEVQGGLQIMEKRPDAIAIFIAAPSLEALEARLRGRGDTAEDVIRKRLDIAKQEYRVAPRYQYVVVNDAIEDAVNDVASILRADALRGDRQKDVLNLDTKKGD